MMRPNSLTLRVFLYLALSQMIAAFVAWLVVVAMFLWLADFDFELADIAFVRARDFVVASIARGPDGRTAIVPNKDLKALLARTPALDYAVFDPAYGAALEGSSARLAGAFTGISTMRLRYVDFTLAGAPPDTRGTSMKVATPFGLYYVAVHGYRFEPADLYYYFWSNGPQTGSYFFASFTAATFASWFAIRRGLAPLRRISDQAARIDLDSLHRGLPTADAPREILPLVAAVNEALARVDASVARMRRFTANAAHELRTPLAIMRARLEGADWPPRRGDLLRDASRMQALVEQVLISTRLQEKQAAMDQDVDLVEALCEIVSDYTPLAIECGRRIDFDAPDSPVIVRANRRAIECVIGNLIGNALRAEPVGGAVLLSVSSQAAVSVADHGEGVALEEREMIFEPFWRRDESLPGAGLGLAISRDLVDKLKGEITVEETPGGGATFRVVFARG